MSLGHFLRKATLLPCGTIPLGISVESRSLTSADEPCNHDPVDWAGAAEKRNLPIVRRSTIMPSFRFVWIVADTDLSFV